MQVIGKGLGSSDLGCGVARHSDGYSGGNSVGGLSHAVEYASESRMLLGL